MDDPEGRIRKMIQEQESGWNASFTTLAQTP